MDNLLLTTGLAKALYDEHSKQESIPVSDEHEHPIEFLAYEFSKCFFSSSIKEYLEQHSTPSLSAISSDLLIKIDEFSKIYKDIHTIRKCQDDLTTETRKNGLLTVLNEEEKLGRFILKAIENSKSHEYKRIFCLKSPVGSYKNRLLQYIYLYCAATSKTFLPLYIDLSVFEGADSVGEKVNTLLKQLENLISTATLNNKTTLVFFDNVRRFECGMRNHYDQIFNFVNANDKDCKIVVGTDTLNTATNRKDSNALSEDYINTVKITSLNLDRKKEAIAFIENCISCFKHDVSLSGSTNYGKTADEILSTLIDLKFVALDAYIVKKMLEIMVSKSLDGVLTHSLSGIYAIISNIKDTECFEEAFLYDYDINKNWDDFKKTSKWWRSAIDHRSVFDYYTAKYYYNCLKKILTNNGKISDLPDIILTNSINRFLLSMLNTKDWEMFIEYIKLNFGVFDIDNTTIYCSDQIIAQVSFLIGRVPKEALYCLKRKKIDVSKILKEIKTLFDRSLIKMDNEYNNNATRENLQQLRIKYFLLRTIQVDLIKNGDINTLNEYIEQLISNKIANDVNTGYHLDYYGDVCVFDVPHHSFINVNLQDLTSKGVNTLRKLCIKIENCIYKDSSDDNFCMLTLNLYTYCELIQTRKISNSLNVDKYYIDNHIDKCTIFLNRFCSIMERNNNVEISRDILQYFLKKRDELNRKNFNRTYNKLNFELSKPRQGWLKRNISGAESISEHMYNTWLMAVIYLPDIYEDEDRFSGEYSKGKILNLLLIHDIGEADIGDIIRGQKTNDDRSKEENAVHSFVDTFFPKLSMELIALWRSSESKDNDINARIAKDIDYIQAVYQYCCYVKNGTSKFNEHDWESWCKDLEEISTNMGRKIIYNAILNNPEFTRENQSELSKAICNFKSKFKQID